MIKPGAASGNLRGILWMSMAALVYTVMNIAIRKLSADFSTFEILFFRNLIIVTLMLPWLIHSGFGALKTDRMNIHLMRSGVSYFAGLTWFYALAIMPLGEAVALHFTLPLFATLAAVFFLGERVDLGRWGATALGFAGVLVIMRPGVEAVSTGAVVVLLSAAFSAWATILIKVLARTEAINLIVFYLNALMLPISLVPALFFWITPGWADIPWILLLGTANWAAHQCLTRSLAAADASVAMPFDYLRMPFTAAVGFLVFAEVLDFWIWVGSLIIFASTILMARREARSRRAPPPKA